MKEIDTSPFLGEKAHSIIEPKDLLDDRINILKSNIKEYRKERAEKICHAGFLGEITTALGIITLFSLASAEDKYGWIIGGIFGALTIASGFCFFDNIAKSIRLKNLIEMKIDEKQQFISGENNSRDVFSITSPY